MPNKAQDPASSLGLLQGAFCPLQRRSTTVLGARQAKAPQREGGEGMGDAYAKRVLLTAAGLPQLATRSGLINQGGGCGLMDLAEGRTTGVARRGHAAHLFQIFLYMCSLTTHLFLTESASAFH